MISESRRQRQTMNAAPAPAPRITSGHFQGFFGGSSSMTGRSIELRMKWMAMGTSRLSL